MGVCIYIYIYLCVCVCMCNFPVDGGVRAHGTDQAEGRSTISVVSCLVQRVVVLFSRDRERVVLVIV